MDTIKSRRGFYTVCLADKLLARFLLFFFVAFTYAQKVSAEIVSVSLPNNLVATAEYKRGEQDKPAIIVIHGFLQTYTFQATHNIIEGLASLDYTVLGPNLSLGVPNRKRSLQCEAIHQHTLNDDINELAFWLNWLKEQGHNKFIFVGHSRGSQQILKHLENDKEEFNVLAVLAISLLPGDINKHEIDQLIRAQVTPEKSSNELQKFELGHCRNYTSTMQSYLSYAKWDEKEILSSISAITSSGIPVFAVMGGADKRLPKHIHWLDRMRQAFVNVSVIDGANHFFSASSEFDLIDELEIALNNVNLQVAR